MLRPGTSYLNTCEETWEIGWVKNLGHATLQHKEGKGQNAAPFSCMLQQQLKGGGGVEQVSLRKGKPFGILIFSILLHQVKLLDILKPGRN